MKLFFRKSRELHLENYSELLQLAKKRKISLNELYRAIVETGTVNIKELKMHIKSGRR